MCSVLILKLDIKYYIAGFYIT